MEDRAFVGVNDKARQPIHDGDVLRDKSGRLYRVAWWPAKLAWGAYPLAADDAVAPEKPHLLADHWGAKGTDLTIQS